MKTKKTERHFGVAPSIKKPFECCALHVVVYRAPGPDDGAIESHAALGTAYAVLPFLGPGAIQFIGRVDDFIFGWVGTKDEVWGELLLLEVIPRPHLLAARN